MAVITIALSIGMALGPILGGAIVDLVNINAAFYFSASLALAGAGFFVWFTRSRGNHRAAEIGGRDS
jgi:predicted MFS family arabinose efflux permease